MLQQYIERRLTKTTYPRLTVIIDSFGFILTHVTVLQGQRLVPTLIIIK